MKRSPFILPAALLLLAGCAAEPPLTMRILTPSWGYGSAMPATYTCLGANVSPPLGWDRIPEGAQSLVLVMEDRDAKNAVHWLAYDIPADATGSPEKGNPAGAVLGATDFDAEGYSGPCPPAGERHRYAFRLYALDTQLSLPAGATRDQVMEAAKGHIIARGELMGTYTR